MKAQTKLTSVNLIDDVYRKFKINTIDSSVNLQKLVNRSLDLYNNDQSFREKIDQHNDLAVSGSKF